MMKRVIIAFTLISLTTGAYAQNKKAPKPAVTISNGNNKVAKLEPAAGFKSTNTGIDYKIAYDAPGDIHPKIGDFVDVHIATLIKDSMIFSTRAMNNNQPVQIRIQAPTFTGDLVEGVMMMTAGDSAIFKLSTDSLVKSGQPKAPWMETGVNQKITYLITLVSVKDADEMQKEQAAKSAAQVGIDEKLIKDYLAKNKITATRTASGLYYKIDRQGAGAQAKAGDTVIVNYTGKTLEGKTFDSNVEPEFQHVEPFKFNVGMGQVIKGWDEGFMILKKGTKGTLYIPSGLAYGANSPDPSKIPVNGILVFDVEMMDVKAKQ